MTGVLTREKLETICFVWLAILTSHTGFKVLKIALASASRASSKARQQTVAFVIQIARDVWEAQTPAQVVTKKVHFLIFTIANAYKLVL